MLFNNATFTNSRIIWDCTFIALKDLKMLIGHSPIGEKRSVALKESNGKQGKLCQRKGYLKAIWKTVFRLGLGSYLNHYLR